MKRNDIFTLYAIKNLYVKQPFSYEVRNPDEFLFHYTSMETFLGYLMPNLTIRFSPMSKVNDPKESRFSPNFWGKSDIKVMRNLSGQLKEFFEDNVKIACFSRDTPSVAFDAGTHMFHGWSKPTMWAHYGSNHSGVCVAFKKQTILDNFKLQFSDSLKCFYGNVNYQEKIAHSPKYRTEKYKLHDSWFDISDLENDFDSTVHSYLDKNFEEMFFRKHGDWSNEREFRLLIASQNKEFEYLDISESIVGICVGLESIESDCIVVQEFCERNNLAFTKTHNGCFR